MFLTHIEHTKWPMTVVDTFNWFFYNLEMHVLRQEEEDGERILLHYMSRVWANWHNSPPAKQFNIALINENLMHSIVCELHSRELGRGMAW
ncbi:hypothetical protein ID866_9910 [Astraeus odoratus]|nr:hypothetical protein ID866_9910 [Astraeus odoratus]